jgi:hypothetical protein
MPTGGTGGGGGGGQHPQSEDPQGRKPEKKDEKPDGGDKRSPQEKEKGDEPPPEGDREKPRNPEFDKWFAELPPQVRKAYETQDWDSIPPRWRELLRAWTKKMAEDLEKERR